MVALDNIPLKHYNGCERRQKMKPEWYPEHEPEGCGGIMLGIVIALVIWAVGFGLLWWWLT